MFLQVCFSFISSLFRLTYLDYEPEKTKLYWARIYFDTTTYERITRDQKANLETKLSVIGGTMGLLTGFSIISGVEIVFFGVKILLGIIKDRRNSKQKVSSNVK